MPIQQSKMLQIGSGQNANYKTLEIMKRLVNDAKRSGYIRQFSASLVNHLNQKDYYGEIVTIHKFVRDNVRYVRDIRGIETLHGPEFILKNRYGDCDDKTMLTCAMLESLGHKTRMTIVAIGLPYFCHVYPEVLYNGKWLALEVTEPVEVGWRPPSIVKSHSLEIDNGGASMSSVQFDDYLNPQEQETAVQLMYLRHYFPNDYKNVVAFNRKLKNTSMGGLSEIEALAYVSDEFNGIDGLGRFKLKKAFKKVAKVIKKANPVYHIAKKVIPKKTYAKLKSFEQKHRKDIKKVAGAIAVIGGGFMFAPSIMAAGKGIAGAAAKLGTMTKGAALKAAAGLKNLSAKLPPELRDDINAKIGAELQNVQQRVDDLPQDAQNAVDKAAQEIIDKAKELGVDKLQSIANRYTNNGTRPFNRPDDPRLSQATNEALLLNAQQTGNPDNAAINAGVIASIMADAQKLREPANNNMMPFYIGGGVLALALLMKR